MSTHGRTRVSSEMHPGFERRTRRTGRSRAGAVLARRGTRIGAMVRVAVLLTAAPAPVVAETLPVQGVVRDNAGTPVPEGAFRMTFRLYAGANASDPVWKETHPSTEDDCEGADSDTQCVEVHQGVFTARLGATEPEGQPSLTSLFAEHETLWLGVSVEGEPELPRRPLGASGWALAASHAEQASLASDLACNACVEADDVAFETGLWTREGDDVVRMEGRVGIGTSSPGTALEVAGVVKADGFVASGEGNVLDVATTERLAGDGTSASPLDLARQGASDGEVLTWDGATSSWTPAEDEAGVQGGYFWAIVSVDEGVYRTSEGKTGSLDIPSSGSTTTDGHVAIHNFGSNEWAYEVNVPFDVPDGSLLNGPGWHCWATSVGDNETHWGRNANEGAQGIDTDGNGNCFGSYDDCAAGFAETHDGTSHSQFGIVCRRLE